MCIRIRMFVAAGACTALQLLQPAGARAQACPGDDPAIEGQVYDASTRVVLVGARVTATFRREGERRDRTQHVETAERGAFRICDVPADAGVRLQARYMTGTSEPVELGTARGEPVQIGMMLPQSVLIGRVADAGSGAGLASAAVRLEGTPLETLTATDGRFRFARVPPGAYDLRVDHIGYQSVNDSVRVDVATTVDVAVRMSTDAVRLAPLHVTTRSFRLERVGFYERRERMPGSFITRDEIVTQRAHTAIDLLRSLPGIRITPRRGGGQMPVGRGNCGFRYIIDGAHIGPYFEIDDLRPDVIEGIEVYRGASEVPGEFMGPITNPRANCGLIVVWTRVR
jgi:hypothetical protein